MKKKFNLFKWWKAFIIKKFGVQGDFNETR